MHEPTRSGWIQRLRGLAERAFQAIARLWAKLGPGPGTWRGATIGLFTAVVVLYGVQVGMWLSLTGLEQGILITLIVCVVLIALAGPILSLLAWLFDWLVLKPMRSAPVSYRWAFVSAFMTVGLVIGFGARRRGMMVMVLLFVVSASLLGAGLWGTLRRGEPERRQAWRRALSIAALLVGLLLVGWQVAWLTSDGPHQTPRLALASSGAVPIESPALSNPGEPGPFAVRTLTYGSGRDPQRPEYGAEVDLVTESVDGSALVGGWDASGVGLRHWPGRLRARFFGCDARSIPLQGRVWYPERTEPSPLVVMVHGNHLMNEFSDPGYDYLGELLASRGFVFVSIDANFLNKDSTLLMSAFLPPLGRRMRGLSGEWDGRAWLLLEHLRVWHEWNAAPEGPFAGRIDTGNIGLVGHSAGGEAVALAALFNRLSAHPDNALIRFDYDFDIRAVIAVAPIDGRYRPAGALATPEGIHYFTIHGSRDSDVSSFEGANLYQRLAVGRIRRENAEADGERLFKSALYVHRANHGMFNRVWGQRDLPLMPGRALDVRSLLEPSEQEAVARVYFSAFFEATLNSRDEYRALFRDPRAGAKWLPETVYLHRFAEAGDRLLATFEEDVDPATTTIAGGALTARGLAVWREEPVRLKRGNVGTNAVRLGWWRADGADKSAPPYYQLELPADASPLAPGTQLLISLADARVAEGAPREPLDWTVLLTDTAGATAALPQSHFAPLEPQLAANYMKSDWILFNWGSESILQDVALPLDSFAARGRFDPTRLASIRLVFDRSADGMILVDDLGLREPD